MSTRARSKTRSKTEIARVPKAGEDGLAESEEAEFQRAWAHVPDFVKPDYPLDIPPARLPFVQFVFTHMGAFLVCPEARCRRSRACKGGDGPPCYRADRRDLAQVLCLWWMWLFANAPREECIAALRRRGNRYTPPPEPETPARRKAARKGRRR